MLLFGFFMTVPLHTVCVRSADMLLAPPITTAFLLSVFLSGNIIMMLTADVKIPSLFIPETETIKKCEENVNFTRILSSDIIPQITFLEYFFPLIIFSPTSFHKQLILKSKHPTYC